jgi:hypothetical protein
VSVRHAIELRVRGTCPGSPGYLVCSHPDELPVLPRWLAGLAGPPPAPTTLTMTGRGGAHAQARLAGIIGRLLAARRGERNQLLFWASPRAGELVADVTSMRARPPGRSSALLPRLG